jgi:hypothetical protein
MNILKDITTIITFSFLLLFSFYNPHFCVDKSNQQQGRIQCVSGLTTQREIKSLAAFSLGVHIAIRVSYPLLRTRTMGQKG